MTEQAHVLAQALNADLQTGGGSLFGMLSVRGQRAFFPSRGILGQSAEAKDAAINATIGTAFEEDGSPLCLECLEELVNLPSTAYLYAPSFGQPGLRDAWRDMLLVKNPSLAGKKFSLPVVTHALTHGLSIAGYLFADPGEALILPDLYWDNYELLFEEAYGGTLTTFPMFAGDRFNVAGMERLLLAPGDKKIVILNFPNNPTGYTATEDDVAAIRAALLRAVEAGKRVVVILDDAYFGLVYEPGVSKESLFADLCDLHPNLLAVKLDGPTKEDYVWGIRVGFMTFGCKGATPAQYKALEAKAAGAVRGSISSVTNIGQSLLLNAYRNPAYAAQKQEKYNTLKRRYERIKAIFAAHPEYTHSFVPMPFNSGYFMCVKPLGVDAEAVRKRLLATRGTGVIVLMGLIRLAFSSVPCDKLDALFDNLHAVIQELKAAHT
ncbi:MAG: aminotransferase class I/II-fold pyridoxal phosphate-dependent enzyme [Kiritimatiellae bacterium]|nr:aminotransferase class I/II-fold pyridoxal phosphate-dependent enzyme [Kiritimatiellia bacterium]